MMAISELIILFSVDAERLSSAARWYGGHHIKVCLPANCITALRQLHQKTQPCIEIAGDNAFTQRAALWKGCLLSLTTIAEALASRKLSWICNHYHVINNTCVRRLGYKDKLFINMSADHVFCVHNIFFKGKTWALKKSLWCIFMNIISLNYKSSCWQVQPTDVWLNKP